MAETTDRAQDAVLTLLGCPLCGGGLISEEHGGLRCPTDGGQFPRQPSGLFDLRTPDNRAALDQFAATYRAARLAEGWSALPADVARRLPEADPPGFNRLYWPLRRESWRALERVMGELGPEPHTIADAGAGFLWSSYRLAMLGHRVVAFDVSADANFGLGAARLYPTRSAGDLQPGEFLPVLGELQHPPLAAGSYDLILCNASLHYVNSLSETLTHMARALRMNGVLIILDSPVAPQGWTTEHAGEGVTRGNRVFSRDELNDALRNAGLAAEWIAVRRGWLWTRHRLKNRLRGRPGFDFPLIVARNSAAPEARG